MYDASGERYLKGTLLFDEVDVDGNPVSGTDVTTSDYTVYVNPYLVYNSKFENQYGYSKHYYIGSERVASAIGNGSVNSNSNPVVGPGTESLTVHPIWSVLNGYLSDLSITIGSYTGYESTSTTTPLYEGPNDCKKLLKNDQEEVNNCLCTYFPATAVADGINCDNYTPIYWYHPDYLGNTEFVTDILGRPYQHFFYSPFGEELVEQEPYYGNYYSPYHFNAKEVDSETGYHYYGARYYNSNLSVWLSVDPWANKFPAWTPYKGFMNNPVVYTDPNGQEEVCETCPKSSEYDLFRDSEVEFEYNSESDFVRKQNDSKLNIQEAKDPHLEAQTFIKYISQKNLPGKHEQKVTDYFSSSTSDPFGAVRINQVVEGQRVRMVFSMDDKSHLDGVRITLGPEKGLNHPRDSRIRLLLESNFMENDGDRHSLINIYYPYSVEGQKLSEKYREISRW